MRHADVKRIVEAALLAADEPVSVDRLAALFTEAELVATEAELVATEAELGTTEAELAAAQAELAATMQDAGEEPSADPEDASPQPDPASAPLASKSPRAVVRAVLAEIEREAEGRGYELAHVASGYRFQVRQELSPWVSRLFDERPPRYSRALLETLALIVYRQPITRGEVEDVRGVSVSASIMRTLLERGWIRAVGQRETPGRPTMYGTTRAFLDYFNLRSLSELPPLDEIKSLIEPALEQNEANEANEEAVSPDDATDPSNVVRLPTADDADDADDA